jgi:hypothetical protein
MRWQGVVAEVIRTVRRWGAAGIAGIVLVAIAAALRVPEDGWNGKHTLRRSIAGG